LQTPHAREIQEHREVAAWFVWNAGMPDIQRTLSDYASLRVTKLGTSEATSRSRRAHRCPRLSRHTTKESK
jgi:hypothetical protein